MPFIEPVVGLDGSSTASTTVIFRNACLKERQMLNSRGDKAKRVRPFVDVIVANVTCDIFPYLWPKKLCTRAIRTFGLHPDVQ